MRFLVDMPLSPVLAAWLRDQGHDAVHAAEIGLHRRSDTTILDHAKRDGRTVVTADLDYLRDGNWSDADVIARMEGILRTLEPDALSRSILVVDRERVRRRRLPIKPC